MLNTLNKPAPHDSVRRNPCQRSLFGHAPLRQVKGSEALYKGPGMILETTGAIFEGPGMWAVLSMLATRGGARWRPHERAATPCNTIDARGARWALYPNAYPNGGLPWLPSLAPDCPPRLRSERSGSRQNHHFKDS